MIENVWINERHCALIVRADYRKEGIEFFTGDTEPLQLGYMRRAKGYRIDPHAHVHASREVSVTNEVLLIRRGRVRVNFYDEQDSLHTEVVLETGDVVLLMRCGHGFEMLEDSEIIEVKQGPFMGDRDKRRFGDAAGEAQRGD
jgi:hypothetical protein